MSLICYHGETPHKINHERANEIFKVMLDPINRKILVGIKNDSKTVLQISKDTALTMSMTYRRLDKLNEKKLLIISGDINSQRKKAIKYKSKIRKVVTTYHDNITDVKIYSNLRD